MPPRQNISERIISFVGEIVRLTDQLLSSFAGRRIADQLLRSATSVGANFEEAQGTGSTPDFSNKLQIALKEMRETHYWLCVIEKGGLVPKDCLPRLLDEANQLRAILGKSAATARARRAQSV